jgi:hypothetical protein
LLTLLLPAVLLVMLGFLERYERMIDVPSRDMDDELGAESLASDIPHPRVMPLPSALPEPMTETA